MKARIKQAIPTAMLNAALLRFPALYRTAVVDYETNLRQLGGVDELLGQLDFAVQVAGAVVECGASRCGTSVLMAKHLQELGERRRILACDSFEGFDREELRRERDAGLTADRDDAYTSTSLDYVVAKLNRLGVADVVMPVKGYFEESLPNLEGPFCMAFIDCDLRDSLAYCAHALWGRVSPGGRLVFDDYTSDDFKGARLGVDQVVRDFGGEIADHGLLKRLYYVVKA